MNCHKKCSKEMGKNCPGEVPSLSRLDSEEERCKFKCFVFGIEELHAENTSLYLLT